MKRGNLVRQTMFLSCSHFLVRALGFIMRIWLSREMGAAAMGLVELAHSAQMLLITPMVSGLPAAVSRMCAKASGDTAKQTSVLRCGISLALCTGLPLFLLAFLFREQIALWLGDIRTLPALIVYLPCIPILGVSCVLNGYYYGTGRPVPPALGEIIEQAVRFLLSIRLVSLLHSWPMSLRSAIPAASALTGETVSLLFMLLLCARALFTFCCSGSHRAILREMLLLALPLTGMKLVSSLMRTVTATLVPERLQLSGLPQSEALSLLGMMNGMLMPMLMLPSFITGSLCMVAAPELARRQAKGQPLDKLCLRIGSATLGVGLFAMSGVWLFAPAIAATVYRQAELLPMLRICCPLIPVMALSQVVSGMMNGLGLQSASLRISLLASFTSVVLTYVLTARPSLQLWGALIAMGAAQMITLSLSLIVLKQTINPDSKYTAR